MKMFSPPHDSLFVMLYDELDGDDFTTHHHHGYYPSIQEAADAFYDNYTGNEKVTLVGIAEVVAYPETRWKETPSD